MSNFIAPTIGRVVLYFPSDHDIKDGMVQYSDKPLDAHVCFVWSDTCVNLAVFDHAGNHWKRTSVAINMVGSEPHAEWMPYQIGQAGQSRKPA